MAVRAEPAPEPVPDMALELAEDDGFIEIRSETQAQASATFMIYVKPKTCDMAGILTQRWQYKRHKLPYSLRQKVPRTATALGAALGRVPADKALAAAVDVLRRSARYLRGTDHASR